MAATKIATCCYCGTKAALVLRGTDQHELSCRTCGAPLRSMKMLPIRQDRVVATVTPSSRAHLRQRVAKYPEYPVNRPKKQSRTKSFGRRVMSGIWDILEDVVDEVFD